MLYYIALAWLIFAYKMWFDAVTRRPSNYRRSHPAGWVIVSVLFLVIMLILGPLDYAQACVRWKLRS